MARSVEELLSPSLPPLPDPDFPDAPSGWNPHLATAEANAAGIELSEDHWETIRALQSFYARHLGRFGHINPRELHDALDERFHQRGGLRHVYELFPGGPIAQGCSLAGLEPPAGATDLAYGSVM